MAASNAKASVNVKVDAEVKRKADALFKQMGLNTSVGVNMFLSQVVADRALPFVPRAVSELDRSLAQASRGETERFDSFEQWEKDLRDYVHD
jgi:DNA-damage-inducible protein J